jgi:hypothetical protein
MTGMTYMSDMLYLRFHNSDYDKYDPLGYNTV